MVRALLVVVAFAFLGSALHADKPGKPGDKPEVVGVITAVHRDKDPKDRDLGHIMVKSKNGEMHKVIVMKGTDIHRHGKNAHFKDLDKGDHVAVQTKPGHPHVANKIVIRKD
jgi:hypothetical protein